MGSVFYRGGLARDRATIPMAAGLWYCPSGRCVVCSTYVLASAWDFPFIVGTKWSITEEVRIVGQQRGFGIPGGRSEVMMGSTKTCSGEESRRKYIYKGSVCVVDVRKSCGPIRPINICCCSCIDSWMREIFEIPIWSA